jgi:hypothetical protein
MNECCGVKKLGTTRTSPRVSRQLVRRVPDGESSAPWCDHQVSCHQTNLVMLDYVRQRLALSAGYAVSIDVGYQRGGKKSKTGDARADAFARARRWMSARGGVTILREKIWVKM